MSNLPVGRVIRIALLVLVAGAAGAVLHAGLGRTLQPLGRTTVRPVTAILRVALPGRPPIRPPTPAIPGSTADAISDPAWQRTAETVAAEIRLTQHQLLLDAAHDREKKLCQTKWFQQFQGDDAKATAALRRALTVELVPGTALVAVRVELAPVDEAALIANELCERYIARRGDEHRRRVELEVRLLHKESKSVDIELNEEVAASIRRYEQDLGIDPSSQTISWDGRVRHLELLLRNMVDVRAEQAAANGALKRMAAAQETGEALADVEKEASDAPAVRDLRAELHRIRLAAAEAEADGPTTAPAGAAAGTAARLAKREAACQRLLEEATDVARARVLAARIDRAKERVAVADEQVKQVEEAITAISSRLAESGIDLVGRYQRLKQYQKQLQDRQAVLLAEVARRNLYELQVPYSDVEFAARAVPGR